jgi:hypothetical protein
MWVGDSIEIKELKAKKQSGLLYLNFVVFGYFDSHNLVHDWERMRMNELKARATEMMMKEREEGPKKSHQSI